MNVLTAFVLLIALGSPAACEMCVGTQKIVCPTCDGKKTLVADCWLCDGQGKRKCPVCSGEGDPPAMWKGVTPGKGLVPCPNCEKGVVYWKDFGQKDKCRFCSGRGALDCAVCLKTDIQCAPCAGKKKIETPCFDCRATGLVPCPLCVTKPGTGACALCDGSPGPECTRCKSSGRMAVTCIACRGTNVSACMECVGTGRRACEACYGTGIMRYKLVDKMTGSETNGGKKSCVPCGGKGTVDCGECKDRKGPCWLSRNPKIAHENGKLLLECESCYGKGRVECGGCARGPHRGFEVAARALRDRGRFAEAAALFKDALLRAESWYASKARPDETSEEVEARVANREAAIERIRKALRAVEEKATAPGPR